MNLLHFSLPAAKLRWLGFSPCCGLCPPSRAQELKPIQLPKPQMTAGMLRCRHWPSAGPRARSDKPMPQQTLSRIFCGRPLALTGTRS